MKAFPLIALVALAAGCAHPCTTVGWKFEVGKPGTITSPAIVQQGSGPVVVGPMAAGPVGLSGIPARHAATMEGPVPLSSFRSADCTLQDVCDALLRIERRLSGSAREGLPMPKPKE